MEIFITILEFLAVLGVVVLVHEFGHFATAKAFGIKVNEFGFGFPPRLIRLFRRGETEYTINLLPIGGFVRLEGENDPSQPRSLASKGIGTRFIVLTAGVFMNVVLAVVLFAAFFMFTVDDEVRVRIGDVTPGSPGHAAGVMQGDYIVQANGEPVRAVDDLDQQFALNPGTEVNWVIERKDILQPVRFMVEGLQVRAIAPGSPAEKAGVRPEDIILEINGAPVKSFEDLSNQITTNAGQEIQWLIQRGESQQLVTLVPRENPPKGQGATGISIVTDIEGTTGVRLQYLNVYSSSPTRPPWDATARSLEVTWSVPGLLKDSINDWLTDDGEIPFAGPVGIAQGTGEWAREFGLISLIPLAALLSISLAILNILPIPALDGGRLVFVLLEWIRRGKRIPPEKEGLVHLVGFVGLMVFLVVMSYNDIVRIAEGGSLLR